MLQKLDPVLQVNFGDYFSTSFKSFAFWFLFTIIHIGLFAFGWFKQKNDDDLKAYTDLGYSVLVSRAAGLVLCFDCTLLILPTCRNLIRVIRSPVMNPWLPLDNNIFLHKVTAYYMLFFTILHLNGHYSNMFKLPGYFDSLLSAQANPEVLKSQYANLDSATTINLHYGSFAGITGHAMIYVMFFMFTASAALLRKVKFEIFMHTHHLYVIFYILLFFHSFGCLFHSPEGECKGYNTKYYITPAFIAFLFDRLIRVWRSREDTAITDVILHPGKVIELRFEKPSMNYNPGQYLYVNIPEISKYQWHPFTISSTPQEGFFSIHIKVVGDWTTALYDLVSNCKTDNGTQVFPSLRVDGPYGAPAQDLFSHQTSVLISAGIGVTPTAGLLKAVWYAYQRKAPMKLEKLHVIWVCRDMQDIAWFQSLLFSLEEHIPSTFVQYRVYLTGKLQVNDVINIMLNDTKEFDPITQLKSKTMYGRPEWDKLLESIKRDIPPSSSPHDVGIFFCGPPAMGKAIKENAKRASTKNIRFSIHEENF